MAGNRADNDGANAPVESSNAFVLENIFECPPDTGVGYREAGW